VPVTDPSGSRGLYGFDARVAHPARVYDYWLGGKDNFEADRIAGEETIAAYPAIRASARANRASRRPISTAACPPTPAARARFHRRHRNGRESEIWQERRSRRPYGAAAP